MRLLRLLRSRIGLALVLLADLLLFAGPQGPFEYTNASFEAALNLQSQVTNEWLARDGVVGTAVGVDGRGHAVLKVYLTSIGAAVFPQHVLGVEVVPEVTGRFVALGALSEDADSEAFDPKINHPRPVPIGVSTGHPDVTAGTIGARVTNGSEVFALSNNHVAANNNRGRKGDELLQPGKVDGGRAGQDAIGTLYDFEPISFCAGRACELNKLDAAIALSSEDDLGNSTPDVSYGTPRSWSIEAALGMSVQKYGRTTGHTQGRISGMNATMDVAYPGGTARFEGQIVISGNRFSAGGDSGSLIVSDGLLLADRRPVGLLFAGTTVTTLANPIDLVLDRFGVKIDGS
jgi:hypothetical protein